MKRLLFGVLLGTFLINSSVISACRDEDNNVSPMPLMTRTVVTATVGRTCEWIGEGLALKTLHEISRHNGTLLGFYLSSQFFNSNKEMIGNTGRFLGLCVGIYASNFVFDTIKPALFYIGHCWKKCALSLWEWDASKSSQRDKVLVAISMMGGLGMFHKKEKIVTFLWG